MFPPSEVAEVAELARGRSPASGSVGDEQRNWLQRWILPRSWRTKQPKEGVRPRELAESGWGVIFAQDADPRIREALKDLLRHRQRQATQQLPGLFRECWGEQGYRPGESTYAFLARFGVGPGPVDPPRMPYYLLLVGGPEEIPFRFQYQLDLQYAVGRLHLSRIEDYARYASAVVAAEQGQLRRPRQMAVFAPSTQDDEVSQLLQRELAAPVASELAAEMEGWQVRTSLGPAASKAKLGELLLGAERPALLFSAGHGVGFALEDPGQRELQGALLCADWPGRSAGQTLGPEHYFSARDVGESEGLATVTFHFACHSAGTPRWDDFSPQLQNADPSRSSVPAATKAHRAFVALLPQQLLARGALAVVGHVERAWDWSYRWVETAPQREVFLSTLRRLLTGHPVGSAMEFFDQRYGELSAALEEERQQAARGQPSTDLGIAQLFAARNDARNYIVLGDPAVRLAVSQEKASLAAETGRS